jgi:hypothetical protein
MHNIRHVPRTTVDLDALILHQLKLRAREEGKSLGEVISEIVAPSLAATPPPTRPPLLHWHTSRMGPSNVDLEDKDALRRALDER